MCRNHMDTTPMYVNTEHTRITPKAERDTHQNLTKSLHFYQEADANIYCYIHWMMLQNLLYKWLQILSDQVAH